MLDVMGRVVGCIFLGGVSLILFWGSLAICAWIIRITVQIVKVTCKAFREEFLWNK